MSYSARKASSVDDVSSSGIFEWPLWLFAAAAAARQSEMQQRCSKAGYTRSGVLTMVFLWLHLNKHLILWHEVCIQHFDIKCGKVWWVHF